MSQNGLFCISLLFPDLTLNPLFYGGCAHFSAFPHHIKSDPFGAMRDLTEMTIYRVVNAMVLDGDV
jgi:hypothetical protein